MSLRHVPSPKAFWDFAAGERKEKEREDPGVLLPVPREQPQANEKRKDWVIHSRETSVTSAAGDSSFVQVAL